MILAYAPDPESDFQILVIPNPDPDPAKNGGLVNNVCSDTFWTLILEKCPKRVHNVSKMCP